MGESIALFVLGSASNAFRTLEPLQPDFGIEHITIIVNPQRFRTAVQIGGGGGGRERDETVWGYARSWCLCWRTAPPRRQTS